MNIIDLANEYINILQPFFETNLRIVYEGDNYVEIILGEDEKEFILVIYREDQSRLYWCDECFIFDKARNLLVSSDTYGEIVYEEKIDTETLPRIICELVNCLKDAVFIDKKEIVIGETPFGYDKIKNYIIRARLAEGVIKEDYKLGNILIQFVQ